jgi:ubiquinone/menaquinone biosynthesis C-methylase UbiE
MIDKVKVKRFWDSRASTYKSLPFESIANLEQDPANLDLKIKLETEKVFRWLGDIAGRSLLDLGAGVGQWAFRFVARGARHVTAVEYSEPLVEIGRAEASERGVSNLEFVASPAEKFIPDRAYDIVFISGLFVYMTDAQAAELLANLPRACSPDSIVLLRDGTGLEKRHEIDDRPSDHLKTRYSATYRTRDEYVRLFEAAGFTLINDENMFDEGCPLNKYPETRLRIYLFRPAR